MNKPELTLEYIYDLDPEIGNLVESLMKSSQKTLDKLVATQSELDKANQKLGLLYGAFYETMEIPVCSDPD